MKLFKTTNSKGKTKLYETLKAAKEKALDDLSIEKISFNVGKEEIVLSKRELRFDNVVMDIFALEE